ncbi:MAG: hydrogenase nickel incorporation protein HypB [Candidatus Hydrogenedentota bacterium]
MSKTVKLEKKVQAKGHEIALELREMFRKKGIFVVNLIGSPGAGKTSLLEALAKRIEGHAAVIEGDLATDNDKRRIEDAGLRAYQINTVGACHLDAAMVRDALKEFPLDDVNLLFIENVGNLVCPAGFEIGEDIKVAIVSVTEGEDKPVKYPKAMKVSSALVITKTDLLPYISCDVDRIERDVRDIVPDMPVFRTATTTGEGVDEFLRWIAEQAAARKT